MVVSEQRLAMNEVIVRERMFLACSNKPSPGSTSIDTGIKERVFLWEVTLSLDSCKQATSRRAEWSVPRAVLHLSVTQTSNVPRENGVGNSRSIHRFRVLTHHITDYVTNGLKSYDKHT